MTSLTKEIWVQMEEHSDLYISSLGRVYCPKRNELLRIRYSTVYPHIYYKGLVWQLHRVIATAFIPNPNNKPVVNHINCDKLDFSISNLEWVTPLENCQHAAKSGRLGKFRNPI